MDKEKENINHEKKVTRKRSTTKKKETNKVVEYINTDESVEKNDTEKVKTDKKVRKIATKLDKLNTVDNSFNLIEVIGLLASSIIITFIIGVVVGTGRSNNSNYISSSITDEIVKNYNIIKNEYPEVSDKDLLNGAVQGMLGSVGDPYASFIESDSNFNTEIKGIYDGLGIQIVTYVSGDIIVNSVFENSGADEAGVKIGDKLLQIDDLTLEDKTGSDFSTYVKNSDKTSFTIKVLRGEEELTFVVNKKTTIIPSVFSEMFNINNKNIGYLQVTIFSGTTYAQFREQLMLLESQGMDSLIIDVRSNNGGMLSTVTSMMSLMFDSSKIMYQTDASGDIEKFYSDGNSSKEYDIVVLVDGGSASASEILTAALSQNLGAKIVGTTTYGKGTVQQVKTLSTGDEYKITTKKWLTPNGTCIDGVGITPDYEVQLDENYYMNPSHETDNQLQKALEILK